MAISRQTKEDTLKSLNEKIRTSQGFVFTHYQGLTVKDITILRRTLRAENVELIVAKKTLLRKALAENGLSDDVVNRLDGSIAIAFGFADEITPAKMLFNFARTHPAVELVGGIVGQQFIDRQRVNEMAVLPSRDELRMRLVWVIKSPLTGLVNVAAASLRNLINVLNSIKDRPALTAN